MVAYRLYNTVVTVCLCDFVDVIDSFVAKLNKSLFTILVDLLQISEEEIIKSGPQISSWTFTKTFRIINNHVFSLNHSMLIFV